MLRDDVTLTGKSDGPGPRRADDRAGQVRLWSCQDFEGRYYNAWQRLLSLDEDPILCSGSATTSMKPRQQPDSTPRSVGFSDPSGRHFGRHKSDRCVDGRVSIAILQALSFRHGAAKIHERYPMIVIWDDHEYSNDCWARRARIKTARHQRSTGTRRRNAERAF